MDCFRTCFTHVQTRCNQLGCAPMCSQRFSQFKHRWTMAVGVVWSKTWQACQKEGMVSHLHREKRQWGCAFTANRCVVWQGFLEKFYVGYAVVATFRPIYRPRTTASGWWWHRQLEGIVKRTMQLLSDHLAIGWPLQVVLRKIYWSVLPSWHEVFQG